MKFDVFHSLGRIDAVHQGRDDKQAYLDFFDQVTAAEQMGFGTVWVAESHFSSEVQKTNPGAVIPHYAGEVGLNNDSVLLGSEILRRTNKVGFGTAIMNIVGGNGGPIAAADRVRALCWYNNLNESPRNLDIGVASGRFPYINRPFGITPRNEAESILWPQYSRMIFVEALEVFLRLVNGETIGSGDLPDRFIDESYFQDPDAFEAVLKSLASAGVKAEERGIRYQRRWPFERLKLIPELPPIKDLPWLKFVLGSADPVARDVGLEIADLDIFNLSFTPPDKINSVHSEMYARYEQIGRTWSRDRMPRTVLVFIDESESKAQELASDCFDTYMAAMKGTAKFPPKEQLMARALIGTPDQIVAQLGPEDPHGFDGDDRLMLWFEFNQGSSENIIRQMRLFSDHVAPHYRKEN